MRRLIIGVVVPVAIVVAYLLYRGPLLAVSKQLSPQDYVVLKSDSWVPFTADVRITNPKYGEAIGRLYRGSDGSERLERYTGPDKGIEIKNITRSRFFTCWSRSDGDCFNGGHWVSQPMTLAPGGYKFGRYMLRGYPVEDFNGWAVHRRKGNDGLLMLEAIALNFYPVLVQFSRGVRFELSGIVQQEPEPSLFEPPSGANITISTLPIRGPGGTSP